MLSFKLNSNHGNISTHKRDNIFIVLITINLYYYINVILKVIFLLLQLQT